MIKTSALARAGNYSMQDDSWDGGNRNSRNENDSRVANSTSKPPRKGSTQSAIDIAKKNYRIEDDDDERDFIDDDSMNSSSVDLWNTTTNSFGRSKSITGKDFDIDDKKKGKIPSRTKSEYEMLDDIPTEDIDADIYVHHDGEDRNIMPIHFDNDDDSNKIKSKQRPSNYFSQDSETILGLTHQISRILTPPDSTTPRSTKRVRAVNGAAKESTPSKSPYLEAATKSKSSLLQQTQSKSSSNFLESLQDKTEKNEEAKHFIEMSDNREREALKEQLEAMKKQNETLQIKITETQKESESLLQKERHEKMLLLQKIEIENKIISQELIETRRKAEIQLKKEKEELILIVKKMEKEKNELVSQIHLSEEKYQNDTERLTSEQSKYKEKLKFYESEKMSLLNQLDLIKLEIERASKTKENSASEQMRYNDLLKQQENIEQNLLDIETNKNSMENSINASESVMLQQANEIEIKLQKEKEELELKLSKMEQEKEELAQHLMKTEQEAQAKIHSLANQLAQEKQAIEDSLSKVEEANKELSIKMKETIDKQKHATTKQSLQLQQEKLILQKQLDDILKEKDLLNDKLNIYEAEAAERERIELETIANQRAELKAMALKMKQDTENERKELSSIGFETSCKIQDIRKKSQYSVLSELSSSQETSGQPNDIIKDFYSSSNPYNNDTNNDANTTGSKNAKKSIKIDETQNITKEFHKQISEKNFDVDNSQNTSNADDSRDNSSIYSEAPNNRPPNIKMRQLSRKSLAEMLEDEDDNEEDELAKMNAAANMQSSFNLQPKSPTRSSPDPRRQSRGIDTSTGLVINESYEEETEEEKNDAGKLEALHSQVEQEIGLSHVNQNGESNHQEEDIFHDLPAPHAAAARGDLEQLQKLFDIDPELLASMDDKRRSPLFYGVAYAHVHVTEYLISIFPYLAILCDEHGDTPLHAAASTGASECLTTILNMGPISISETQEAVVDPNCRNHKGMTPAHMTASADILEMLLTFGGDLTLVDENERSPLFVACAMNRVETADYLIGCIDMQSDKALLKRDKRGDTPLHAAACNGCVDCLLLLLQYAIDPRLTNDKGLKAIDLAVKNKHSKCKDLLAEYHLHFVASSNFDSVLFFTALEGHRQAKEIIKNGVNNDDEGYSIIRKSSVSKLTSRKSSSEPQSMVANAAVLQKAKSFFSLQSDAPLRLESWGQWIAFQDEANGKVFWYNQESHQGSSTEPPEVTHLKSLPVNASMPGNTMSNEVLVKKKSMRLKKNGDWIQYITPDTNTTFFYNDRTREFQWTDPNSNAALSRMTSKQQLRSVANSISKLNRNARIFGSKSDSKLEQKGENEVSDKKISKSNESSFNTQLALDGVNVSDWALYEDPNTGQAFWYNAVTQVSQWECPFDQNMADISASKSQRSNADDNNETDKAAITVTNDEDLGL